MAVAPRRNPSRRLKPKKINNLATATGVLGMR